MKRVVWSKGARGAGEETFAKSGGELHCERLRKRATAARNPAGHIAAPLHDRNEPRRNTRPAPAATDGAHCIAASRGTSPHPCRPTACLRAGCERCECVTGGRSFTGGRDWLAYSRVFSSLRGADVAGWNCPSLGVVVEILGLPYLGYQVFGR